MSAIDVNNLTIKYGKFTAVDNISFNVHKGEIFGIIGPNGAGKTSTLESLEGLRKFKDGSVSIFGEDARNRRKLYSKLGVQLQETKFHDSIKVSELLDLYKSFYPKPANSDELLESFDLLEKKNEFVKSLSGGQRQKLAIVVALIGNPEIVVLDEISTGLDPKARLQIWGKIKELKDQGKTILLTTHFMEEAEYLCDRVCLVVEGRVKASGTLQEVVEQANLKIRITAYANPQEIQRINLTGKPAGSEVRQLDDHVEIKLENNTDISSAMVWICSQLNVVDMDIYKPKLEDVFLHLTGAKLEAN